MRGAPPNKAGLQGDKDQSLKCLGTPVVSHNEAPLRGWAGRWQSEQEGSAHGSQQGHPTLSLWLEQVVRQQDLSLGQAEVAMGHSSSPMQCGPDWTPTRA